MEIAVKSAYYTYKIDSLNYQSRDTDDVDVAYKWNFLQQEEDKVFPPAVSLIAGATIPAKNRDLVTSTVDHWAARIGLSAGSEITWMEHAAGVYADAQVVVQDLGQTMTRDRYYLVNTGFLFPVSKYRNLQMLVEYNLVSGMDVIKVSGGDYSAVTYGLRLVNERFNLSIGTQFLHKKTDGFNDSSRVIGLISLKI